MSRGRWAAVAAILAIATGGGLLAADGSTAVDKRGARVAHLVLASRFVHRRLGLTLVTPPGAGAGRPLLVFLHGRGGGPDSELSSEFFAALRAAGARAPAVAFPDGGDHSYWHDRSGGAWGTYVLREVIPRALAELHADPRRVAVGGISMGGFGAYDLGRLARGRFCAVGGHSAALWTAAVDTAPGAFDGVADFVRHDVIAAARHHGRRSFGSARLWLDGGDQDPFHAADEALAAATGVRMHVWPGGHDGSYWNAHWGDYLRFYSAALAACKVR